MGTVSAYAGDDTQMEVAAGILDRAGELGVTVPDDDADAHFIGPDGRTCSDHTRTMSDGTRGAPSDDDLIEVEELRTENARLPGLLDLDGRPDDGHTRAWLTEPADHTNVHASSTAADKLALSWS